MRTSCCRLVLSLLLLAAPFLVSCSRLGSEKSEKVLSEIEILPSSASAESTTPLLAKLEPETGCYVGAFLGNGYPTEVTTPISQFIDATHADKPHAIYSRYISYNEYFPTDWVEGVAETYHAIPMISYRPTYGLERIREGDARFDDFVTGLGSFGGPIFVRFGYEMNGSSTWAPWNNQATAFVAAFKRAAEYIHREAPEAAMVWCPNIAVGYPWGDEDEGDAYTSYYPDDDGANLSGTYVDWVCLDFYANEQWGSEGRELLPSIGQFPESSVDFYQYFSAELGKPLMIGETASLEDDGGDRENGTGSNTLGAVQRHWLDQLYNVDTLLAYPKLKAIIWFHTRKIEEDLAGNPVWKDFRITSSSESSSPQFPHYAELIADPYFLSGIPGLISDNSPPLKPSLPSGPSSGSTGQPLSYSSSATDPDDDSVRIFFNWCDGEVSTTAYIDSGTSVERSHTWAFPGTYSVTTKAADTSLVEGPWSDGLLVTIEGSPIQLIDNFEGAILAWSEYSGNGTTLTKRLTTGYEGQAMEVSYNQSTSASYWGVMKNLGERDLSSHEGLKFYFKANSSQSVYISIMDNDNSWGTTLTGSSNWELKQVAFADFVKMPFESGDNFLDLTKIREVRFRHFPAASASGTFGVDNLNLLGGATPNRLACVPSEPVGNPLGFVGTDYTYSSQAFDPDGDDVSLVFDWGDGTESTSETVPSGEIVSVFHRWNAASNYQVRVKALDPSGLAGPWSNTVSVIIEPRPDADRDGIPDDEDLCPEEPVHDLIGDPCNHDEDNDGVTDLADSCPFEPNDPVADPCNHSDCSDRSLQDTVGDPCVHNDCVDRTLEDGIGDSCNHDQDGDGLSDATDRCPYHPGLNDIGNPCLDDDDGDGVPDAEDAFPFSVGEAIDTDGDFVGNNTDPNDDNDGAVDSEDPFPLDETEFADTDGDGSGNNADEDDDDDGIEDSFDSDPVNLLIADLEDNPSFIEDFETGDLSRWSGRHYQTETEEQWQITMQGARRGDFGLVLGKDPGGTLSRNLYVGKNNISVEFWVTIKEMTPTAPFNHSRNPYFKLTLSEEGGPRSIQIRWETLNDDITYATIHQCNSNSCGGFLYQSLELDYNEWNHVRLVIKDSGEASYYENGRFVGKLLFSPYSFIEATFTFYNVALNLDDIVFKHNNIDQSFFDPDGDGLFEDNDLCPELAIHDNLGDPCNPDEDGDLIPDGEDLCPFSIRHDLWGDRCNPDDDGDGSPDEEDAAPFDPLIVTLNLEAVDYFAEDFETGDLSRWTGFNSYPNEYQVSTESAHTGAYGLLISSPTPTILQPGVFEKLESTGDFLIADFWVKPEPGFYIIMAIFRERSINYFEAPSYFVTMDHELFFGEGIGSFFESRAGGIESGTMSGVWNHIRIVVHPDGQVRYYENDTLIFEGTAGDFPFPFQYVYLGMGQGTTAHFDDIVFDTRDTDGDDIGDTLDICPMTAIHDDVGDPCNSGDCADLSQKDSVADPCNHNDCPDGSFKDRIGNPCNHTDWLEGPQGWGKATKPKNNPRTPVRSLPPGSLPFLPKPQKKPSP